MRFFTIAIAAVVVTAVLGGSGCATDDGSTTSGWVVIGDRSQPPPPPGRHSRKEPDTERGLENAARNHLRSAYRFLRKDQPDHALRELEKARRKMDRNFWYHYYMGGAYYMKGMYGRARDSWELAYRFTRDYRLRSRIRTCQSFVVFRIQGHQSTIGFLRKAVDIDRDNGTARGLLDDLFTGRDDSSGDRDGSSGDQPAFVGEFLGKSKYGDRDDRSSDDDSSYGERYSDRDGEDDDRGERSGQKGKRYKDDDNDTKKGKGKKPAGKARKPYRIEDDGRFRAYFFVEMP